MQIRPYHPPLQPWTTRTPKQGAGDKVTTFVCEAKEHRQLVQDVRSCLSDELRKSPWRGSDNGVAGHCYVACEAIYHTLGGKDAGWTPQTIRHEGGPHWFLRHEDGTVVDPTADQFRTPVPYDEGRGCGFLTKQPSARAQKVLDRLEGR